MEARQAGLRRRHGVSTEDRPLMKDIERLFTKWPFLASRKSLNELRLAGHVINRKKVQRLMQVMGLRAMVPGWDRV